MAISKVKVAQERAKMKLQSEILAAKVRIEENRIQLANKRQQLNDLKQSTK